MRYNILKKELNFNENNLSQERPTESNLGMFVLILVHFHADPKYGHNI